MGLNLFKSELTQKEIKREIFISIVISYVTIFVNVIISLLYTPFLLKTIGTNQYGIHSFAISIVSWLSIVTTALCSGYLKFATAKAKENKGDISGLNGVYFWFFFIIDLLVIIVGLVVVALFWTGVIPLTNYTAQEKELVAPCVLLMVINSFISIFVSYFSLFESYKERFVWARLISLLQKILNPVISIPFLLTGGNVIAVCIIQVALTLLNLILLSFHAIAISKMKVRFNIKTESDKKDIKPIIIFSLFALLSTAAISINQSADQIILGIAADPTSVAIYQLGLNFVSYLSLFCTSITNSLSTKLYKTDLENKDATNELFLKISRAQMFLALLIVGGFISCGQDFMILWAGNENSMAFYIGAMLFVANIFSFTSTSSEVIVKSRGHFKAEAIIYLIEALINVALSILFVDIFDKRYAVIVCCSVTVIVMILFRWIGLSIFLKKKNGLPIGNYYLDLLKFSSIAFVCVLFSRGMVNLFLNSSHLIKLLVGGFSFTIPFLFVIFAFQKNNIKLLANIFKR